MRTPIFTFLMGAVVVFIVINIFNLFQSQSNLDLLFECDKTINGYEELADKCLATLKDTAEDLKELTDACGVITIYE